MTNPTWQWDEYFDGGVHRFVRGKDFSTNITSFRSSINTQARDRGFGLKTESHGDTLYVLAYPVDKFNGGLEMLYREQSMRAIEQA